MLGNCGRERPALRKLVAMLVVALYLINLGYGFEGAFKQLKDYTFISESLSGNPCTARTAGNRFRQSLLGELPVPFPANYVLGIDTQKFDFEVGKWSYIRGTHKYGGWWWYYLYGLGVKEPLGNIILVGMATLLFVQHLPRIPRWRGEAVLLTPAVVAMLLISSQTGFSRYVRYVVPCLPFFYVWAARVGLDINAASRLRKLCIIVCLAWSVASSLWIVPHSTSFFNELTGGPHGGAFHLLDANIDWGQDYWYLKAWTERHPEASHIGLALFGEQFCDPELAGLENLPVPQGPIRGVESPDPEELGPRPGWYAVSVNHVYGYRLLNSDQPAYTYFQQFSPVATIAYSIYIYHIDLEKANVVRARLGLKRIINGDGLHSRR
jgi:hypothetical protein